MAELVDARDLKSLERKLVRVRFSSRVPYIKQRLSLFGRVAVFVFVGLVVSGVKFRPFADGVRGWARLAWSGSGAFGFSVQRLWGMLY